jgi:hypothetical protein
VSYSSWPYLRDDDSVPLSLGSRDAFRDPVETATAEAEGAYQASMASIVRVARSSGVAWPEDPPKRRFLRARQYR